MVINIALFYILHSPGVESSLNPATRNILLRRIRLPHAFGPSLYELFVFFNTARRSHVGYCDLSTMGEQFRFLN